MNLHTLQLNEIRGYGRKKPFLAGCFLMGVLGIGGFPLWNGYVSKTLLHESIVEYIALVGETGGNTFVFSCVEWLFLITGGLTVAYMLKVFLCIFVEKHPEKQEEYDARTKDMSLLTKIAMGLVVVILPILGMFPKKIMQPMADLAGDFFHGGHLAHEIQYFSWVNIKGSLISIGIGLIVYVGIIRPFLLEKEKWPEYLSLERFFTAGLQGCMTLVGGICKGIDVLPDKIAALFWSQPAVSLRTIFKKMDILPESGLLYLGKSIFAETTEPEENVLTKSLHKKLDKKVEIARIIGSSFSFGLLLACVGLLLTILYLLMS